MGGSKVGISSGCALCLPGEGATMVGRIVGQGEGGYLMVVD